MTIDQYFNYIIPKSCSPDYVKIMPMTQRIILPILALILFSACTASPATSIPQPPTEKILPEAIVQQFLTDYQEAPQQLGGYLGETLRNSTSMEEYSKLLPLDGMIEGFAVQSVARSGPQSTVTVAIRAGGAESLILFNLVQQNQNWYINSINTAP
jgi:hypothetical protein